LVSMHKEFARILQGLSGVKPTDGTGNCPPEKALSDLAAGLSDPENAEKLLSHIVQCDHCGPLLKNATDIFSDEISPEEELKLSELASSQPRWQRNLIDRLSDVHHAHANRSTFSWWNVGSWPRWTLATVGSMVLLLTGSALWLRTNRPQRSDANQLLLESYAESRTVNTRFPGAHYAPVHEQRGDEQRSFSQAPKSLHDAEIMIVKALQANPSDPSWLQLKARAEMLEGNSPEAVSSLEPAAIKNPHDSSLQVDLASAYFQTGNYDRAANLLTTVIESDPKNLVALFNRAVVLDAQHKYQEEIADWTRYLELDPTGEWSSEARQHLSEAKAQVHEN
jgi:tetratricopeptide (TPR) repeat protein